MAEKDEEELQQGTEDQGTQSEVDPWAAAFAALDKKNAENSEADANVNGSTNGQAASQTNDGEVSDNAQAGDGEGLQEESGGSDNSDGDASAQSQADYSDEYAVSEEEIEDYKSQLTEDIEDRTINDVAAAYIKQGVFHDNGRLGASIDMPAICKKDKDGVPHFFNPETRREFTGDNPRKQAQEWVDEYNKDLAEAFNATCTEYSQKLLSENDASLKVFEFADKYNKLDPARQAMFDSIVENYEITDDDGDVIGYSCDLDKALTIVNNQVSIIQSRFGKRQDGESNSSGPALDMPNASTSQNDGSTRPQINSLQDAMLYQQNKLLEKQRGNN